MFYAEMGTVYQFLLKNRIIESKTTAKRRSRQGESEAVHILKGWDIEEIEHFEEFLNTQGFSLHIATDQDYKGIPIGGKVWLMKRLPQEEVSSFLSIEPTIRAVRIKETESKEVAGVWFLHIWLIYLYLTYTKLSRTPEQVSRYEDAFFREIELIEAVREHLEAVRSSGVDDETQKHIIEILDSEKGTDVSRRVKGFLEVMLKSQLIIKFSDSEYQQSLLGAIEISDSYRSIMLGTIVTKENTLNTLTELVTE